jgi:hypothetical protein
MGREDSWTAAWLASRIRHDEITDVQVRSGNSLLVKLKKRPTPTLVATTSGERLSVADLPPEVHLAENEFLINIKSRATFLADAIALAHRCRFGLGSVGNFYSACGTNDLKDFLDSETGFILRGLQQHSAISSVERLTTRSYLIHRHLLPSVTLVAISEYDVTAEALRAAISLHGRTDFVLASNPNSRFSEDSIAASRNVGVKLMKWRNLLGALQH